MGRFGTTSKDLSAGWMPTLKKTLLDHFEVLHDESQEISPHWTTAILLFCCCLQTFFISRLDVYSLDQVSINEFILQTIIILMFSVPFIVLGFTAYYSLLARLQPKTIYSRRSRSFASSFGFTIYKYLYRLHFFITEPVSSGFLISILVVSDSNFKFKESIYPSLRLLLIIPTAIGIVQSLAYILFVESVLPGDHILSASSRTNTAMINLSIRTGIATDSLLVYVSQKNFSMGMLGTIQFVRILPSLIAIYWNLQRSFFFHIWGRVASTSFHSFNILITLVYLLSPKTNSSNSVVKPIIVPSLLLLIFLMKFILTIDNNIKHTPIDPDSSSLYTILQTAHSYLLVSSVEDEGIQEDIRTHSQIASLTVSKDVNFEAFKQQYGFVGLGCETDKMNYILYLFEKLKHREASNHFMITLYQAYYLISFNFNIFFMSVLLANLKSAQKSIIQKAKVSTLIRLLDRKLTDIYVGKQAFCWRGVRFYKDDQRDENMTNKGVDNREYWMNKFDIFNSLTIIEVFERMIIKMVHVVGVCMMFYDKMSTVSVDSSETHRIVHQIYSCKKDIETLYLQIEHIFRNEDHRNTIHLLPYGVFINILENDRPRLLKLLKLRKDRESVMSRLAIRRYREGNIIKYLDYENMVCIMVRCMKDGLGNILYVTKNSEGVLGVLPDVLEKKNISHLMSDDFQVVHSELLYSFVKFHDKNYLGKEKVRYLKIKDDSTFIQSSIITKLSPVSNEEIRFISLIKLENSRESFILLNSCRRITGFGKYLRENYSIEESFRNKRLSHLSIELDDQYISAICHYLARTYKLSREELLRELHKFRISCLDAHKESSPLIDKHQEHNPGNLGIFANINLRTYPEFELENRIVFKDNVSFEFMSIKDPHHGIFFEAILRLNVNEVKLASFKKAIEFDNSSIITPKLEKVTSAGVYKFLHRNREKALTSGHKLNQRYREIKWEKRTNSNPSMITVKDTVSSDNMSSDGDRLRIKESNERKMSKDSWAIKRLSRPSISEKISSEPDTYSLRNKLNILIKQRSRNNFILEIISILIVQILVWSMGTYIIVLMESSFGTQMATIIDLRKGLNFNIITNLQIWDAAIGTFEYVLEKKGIIVTNRYTAVLPNYTRNLSLDYRLSYWRATTTFNRFRAHVFKFKWDYAKRYLHYTTNYTMKFSNYPNGTSNSTTTRDYNYVDYYRIALTVLRAWNRDIELLDLNVYSLQLVTEIIGPLILDKLRIPTLLLLMDADSVTYNKLTNSVQNIVIAAILFSLIIANTIIVIIYLINRKIVVIYTAFDKLYDFEIKYHKANLHELKKILNTCLSDSTQFYDDFTERFGTRCSNVYAYLSIQNRQRRTKSDQPPFFLFNGCFGMLIFALINFILMEAYNVTAYTVLNDVIDQTNNKLEAMVFSRSLTTSNAAVHIILFRAHLLAISKSGIGMKFINITNLQEDLRDIVDNMNKLWAPIEKLTSSKTKLQNGIDSLGFEIYNMDDSCRFMNRTEFNVTLEECRALGDHTMGKSPIEVYRWLRLTIETIVSMLENSTPHNILNVLSTKEFLVAQIFRRGMTIQFVNSFNTQLYQHLEEYHRKTLFVINILLGFYLLVSVLLASVLNLMWILHLRIQIKVSFSSLFLLPTESHANNPYIAVLVNALHKY